MKKRILLFFIPALLAASCKCDDKMAEMAAEKLTEKALESEGLKDAELDVEEGKLSVKTKKGEMKMSAGADVELPEGFPKDIYLPEDRELTMAMEMPQKGFMVGLSSDTPVSELSKAFVEKSLDEGWKKNASMDMGKQKMLNFEKAENMLNVVISSDEKTGKSAVQLTVSKKE